MTPKTLTPLIFFIFTSCAGIINQPITRTIVHVKEPTRLVVNGDTLRTITRQYPIVLERSSEPVELLAITDSTQTKITLQPRGSFAWWANIFCNYGIGMLVDKNNPKRYTYPNHLYLDREDSLYRFTNYQPDHRKGQWQLHLSLPYINNFYFQPREEKSKANTGFLGLSVGLNYYHSKKQFLKLSTLGVLDFMVPFPAHVDYSGGHEFMRSVSVSLSNNHHWKRFTLGYGISLAKNIWEYRYYNLFEPPPPTRDPVVRRDYSLGLLLSTYYNVGKRFGLGLIYRPTFARLNKPADFAYEHLISVDIAWKIVVKR
jgi:hypothetical protein